MLRKEFDSLVNGHVEHVAYIPPVETHIQYFGLETLAVTTLTGQH